MKRLPLTKAKYNRLADICEGIAQIALASVIIPFLIDKFDLIKVIWGTIIAIVFWIFSYKLTK